MYSIPVYCEFHGLSFVPADDASCPICDALDEESFDQYDDEVKFMDRLSKSTEQLAETFIGVLKDFDIPDGRRNVKPDNLRWIRRNVAIRNGGNPMLKWVMATIDCLLNE